MSRKIKYIIGCTTFISIVIQCIFFNGFNKENLESLNINFLAGIASIVITYLVIDQLLEGYEEERKITFINDVVKNEYMLMLNTISQYYISYITKKPPSLNQEIDSFDKCILKILKEIDFYIDKNFIKEDIIVMQPDFKKSLFDVENKKYSYPIFCEIMKSETKIVINEFIIKYNSLIPEEVIIKLSSINNSFMKPIFTTGIEQGLQINLLDIEFDPKHFIDPVSKIGNYIIELYRIG